MIYLIHDRIISGKVIATSDTHIKVNSTSFRLFSCLSFLLESVVFSLPFFCKISSLKQSNLSKATNETVRKNRKGYRVREVVIYIYIHIPRSDKTQHHASGEHDSIARIAFFVKAARGFAFFTSMWRKKRRHLILEHSRTGL